MRYVINDNKGIIEIYANTSNIRVYKIPFDLVKDGSLSLSVRNKFIVYILYGRQDNQGMVYVGKSVNGLKNRPLSHQDRCQNWNYCFVLTQTKEGSFLNDGTIQYLENQISSQISADKYYINTTKQTNKVTANEAEIDDCKEFLKKAYRYLQILGLEIDTAPLSDIPPINKDIQLLHLHLHFKEGKSEPTQTAYCDLDLSNGKYYLLKGSSIRSFIFPSFKSSLNHERDKIIKDGSILKKDMVFNSASTAASFVTGSNKNGKLEWKTENGITLKDWLKNNKK